MTDTAKEIREFLEAFKASGLDVTEIVTWTESIGSGWMDHYRLALSEIDGFVEEGKGRSGWLAQRCVRDAYAAPAILHTMQADLDEAGVGVLRHCGGYLPYMAGKGFLCADGQWYRSVGETNANTFTSRPLATLAGFLAIHEK